MTPKLPIGLRLYVFLIGFGWAIDVSIVGRFALAEILMYLALPVLLAKSKVRIWNKTAVTFFALIAVFAFAVIVSDLINDNNYVFFIRGFARPIAIALNTLCMTLIVARSPRLLLDFALGMLPGACIGYFQGSEFHDLGYREGYKYFSAKFEPILRATAIVSGIFFYRFNRLLAALVMVLPGLVVAVYGSRSGASFYFLAGGTIAFLWLLKGQRRRIVEMNARFVLLTLVGLFLAVSAAYIAYVYAAPKGILGERQQVKFYDQSTTRFGVSPVGLLFSGRTAVVGGALAAVDNPIIGLGSWPNIGDYLVDAVLISGDTPSEKELQSVFMERAAGHSIIIGTWFNNGLLALAFWIYFCFLMAKVFLFLLRRDNLLTPMFVFLFFELSWHLLFSPLGPKSRIYVALFGALAICFIDKRGPLVKEVEFALLSPFARAYQKNTFFRLK